MSTHNIGFYEEISKIISELSSSTHLISSSVGSKIGTNIGGRDCYYNLRLRAL